MDVRCAATIALLAAVGATGCGGDDESGDEPVARTPEVVGALQECRQQIFSNTEDGDARLSPALRAELSQLCVEAADGGVPELREAKEQVCERAVEASVPTGGYAFELSLQQCRDGGRPR